MSSEVAAVTLTEQRDQIRLKSSTSPVSLASATTEVTPLAAATSLTTSTSLEEQASMDVATTFTEN